LGAGSEGQPRITRASAGEQAVKKRMSTSTVMMVARHHVAIGGKPCFSNSRLKASAISFCCEIRLCSTSASAARASPIRPCAPPLDHLRPHLLRHLTNRKTPSAMRKAKTPFSIPRVGPKARYPTTPAATPMARELMKTSNCAMPWQKNAADVALSWLRGNHSRIQQRSECPETFGEEVELTWCRQLFTERHTAFAVVST
jgi:hypothetical protein